MGLLVVQYTVLGACYTVLNVAGSVVPHACQTVGPNPTKHLRFITSLGIMVFVLENFSLRNSVESALRFINSPGIMVFIL